MFSNLKTSPLTALTTDKGPNGTMTKEQVIHLDNLTDCFLTHDWGTDELGRSNHERVARVNESLKERGFITWFDSDRLVGNIVSQMCNGIDRTKCIIVFITKNYIEKVSGDNANDNCQLEFNYALRQKSAKYMIPVVMERRVRDTQTWRGAVGMNMLHSSYGIWYLCANIICSWLGMALGGTLYVDLVEDANWEQQCDDLAKRILHLIRPIRKASVEAKFGLNRPPISNGDGSKSGSTTPLAPAAATSSPTAGPRKSLHELTAMEVVYLLRALNLSNYMIVFQKKGVDGATLAYVHSEQEVMDLGVDLLPKARLLFSKILEYKSSGVPVEILSPTAQAVDASGIASPRYFFASTPREQPGVTATAATAIPLVSVTSNSSAPTSARVQHPTMAASNLTSASREIEMEMVGKKVGRYAWFKHQSTTYTLTKPVRRVIVRGVSGLLEKKLNGEYYIYEEDEESNLHHVFRKTADPDIWLEYLTEKKCWQIKSTSSRGSKSCLAEQSCAPNKSMFLCEKAWMVHNGKGAFQEQPSVKVLPFVENVVIFGVISKAGNKLNGKYFPSYEMQCGHPVFFKYGDPEMCIEFNETRSRWQIKTVAARGGNGCIAENGETVNHTSYTPADATTVWVVCEDHKFNPDPNLHVVSEMKSVVLRGGFGKVCTQLSGVYCPRYELSSGQMFYQHQNHIDICLEFVQTRNRWQIKPISAKGTPSCVAELAPSDNNNNITDSGIVPFDGIWSVSENHALQPFPDMYLSPVFEPLFITFSAPVSLGETFDEFMRHCSGVYVPLEKPFQNYPVYRHRSRTHLHYIRFDNTKLCWYLHSSTQLSPKKHRMERQNSGLGELVTVFEHAGRCDNSLEECGGVWNILQEELLESNGATQGKIEVRVLPNPKGVHIVDATGPRALLLNGHYELTDEVNDRMVVYKKRMVISTTPGGSDVEANELWIEYSLEMKSWQLKRTADRGSAKAYASLPAVAPHFVDINSRDGVWTVYDTNQKQWLEQPRLKCVSEVYSVVVMGATGGHGDHINGQYEACHETCNDLPLYRKIVDRPDLSVWLEYNKSLRSWQIKSEKDRGQNKAWAFLTTTVALRPEECQGSWEVFDAELKWHSQPQVCLAALPFEVES